MEDDVVKTYLVLHKAIVLLAKKARVEENLRKCFVV